MVSLINLEAIKKSKLFNNTYPYLMANNVLDKKTSTKINNDFPVMNKTGFFPLELLNIHGAFADLIKELQKPEFSATLTEKLGVELRDKPQMITIRGWSAKKDGRIHNDGAAKIVTALLYLSEDWSDKEDGGGFRVLTSDKSFDDHVVEVSPEYGNFVTFVRTENSWHGHKPFIGKRRVVQITWLRSWEDLERKNKRGAFSFFLKKFLPSFITGIPKY